MVNHNDHNVLLAFFLVYLLRMKEKHGCNGLLAFVYLFIYQEWKRNMDSLLEKESICF